MWCCSAGCAVLPSLLPIYGRRCFLRGDVATTPLPSGSPGAHGHRVPAVSSDSGAWGRTWAALRGAAGEESWPHDCHWSVVATVGQELLQP